MSQAKYFRNEWWDMVEKPDHDRQKKIQREQREVWDEMILQEREAGATIGKIAESRQAHVTTIYRALNRAKYKRNNPRGD